LDTIFGAPVTSIALTLFIIFAIIVIFLAYIIARNSILVRMAFRNVIRRPARAGLIISGLMLATAIISIAFTTGDSVTYSIKNEATSALRELDMFITIDEESELWANQPLPEYFDEKLYQEIKAEFEADPDVESTLADLSKTVAVINATRRQFEINATMIGVDEQNSTKFEALYDELNQPLEISDLGPNEIFIDIEGAEALEAEVGDEIQIALGPNQLTPFILKGISEGYYFKGRGSSIAIMMPLKRAQDLLGEEGFLSGVLITNNGDPYEGVKYSDGIEERLGDSEVLKSNGLKIVPIKADLVELANSIGSLFVTFFTTFGLFSIGVGLLLIFLIFSMLAAERKSEMGMARAVGMQRQQLIRLFMLEGAIYGLGSAIIGVLAGIGIGLLLIVAASNIFSGSSDDFNLSGNVSSISVLTSFLLGAVITFATVFFASWKISKLNIVRAIRDIPDPQGTGRTKSNLIWSLILTIGGILLVISSFSSNQFPAFIFGLAIIPIGLSLFFRWLGLSQNIVLTGAGVVLVVIFVLPASIWDSLNENWTDNFASFFITGTFLVTGAVLIFMNNNKPVLAFFVNTLGRIKSIAPIVKSAVSYPLRYGFRTGLSVAMFSVVIFAVLVNSMVVEGFNSLLDDRERFAGGYDTIGYVLSDLNPIKNIEEKIDSTEELSFITDVSTFRTVSDTEGLVVDSNQTDFITTNITGVDNGFMESNKFRISLATEKYITENGFDSKAVWEDLKNNPGLAVVDSGMIPTKNSFAFDSENDNLTLDVEELFIENDFMNEVKVTIRDLESGSEYEVTVIGVLDQFTDNGPILPSGIFTSQKFLFDRTGINSDATRYLFRVEENYPDPSVAIESGLFEHAIQTLDLEETLIELQSQQRSFFDLLTGFMLLGLVVGIVSLGVISARAVVERRHAIGVMRAIGFSKRNVLLTFIGESSFIGIMGILIGIILGIVTGINVMADIRDSADPDIKTIIPWVKFALIGIGAYLMSLITTLIPALQASEVAPAEALRYE
tara:strand:+ start:20917 stop:23949 length:3033 start_codon:yes stop_codon:yes gene_type:complete